MNSKLIHVYDNDENEIYSTDTDLTIKIIDGCLVLSDDDDNITAIFAKGYWRSVEVW